MAAQILFFAQAAECMGRQNMAFDISGEVLLKDIVSDSRLSALKDMHGLFYAVNRELADLSVVVNDGDEVAIMSPYSGG